MKLTAPNAILLPHDFYEMMWQLSHTQLVIVLTCLYRRQLDVGRRMWVRRSELETRGLSTAAINVATQELERKGLLLRDVLDREPAWTVSLSAEAADRVTLPPSFLQELQEVGRKQAEYGHQGALVINPQPSTLDLKPLDIEDTRPTLEIDVPQRGMKGDPDYAHRCPDCGHLLTQDRDACPECDRRVRWKNSPIADKRYKRQAALAKDARAKALRETRQSLWSPAVKQVMETAIQLDFDGPVHLRPEWEKRIDSFVKAFGLPALEERIARVKERQHLTGLGFLKHLMNALGHYNTTTGRAETVDPLSDE